MTGLTDLKKEELKKKLQVRDENHNMRKMYKDFHENIDYTIINSKKTAKVDVVQKFLNKLKQASSYKDTNHEKILKEMDELNLRRYVGDISKTLCETNISEKDLNFYLQLVSKMHCLYEDFGADLENIQLIFIDTCSTEKDDRKKTDRRKNLLRFAFEILLCWIPFKPEKILKSFLDIILEFKTEEIIRSNLVIMEMFSQHIYEPLFQKSPNVFNEICENIEEFKEIVKGVDISIYPEYITPEKKKDFFEKLKKYVGKIYQIYQEIYNQVQAQEKINHDLIMEKGEVDEENNSKLNELVEKFHQYDNTIAMMKDYLNLQLPRMGEKIEKKNIPGTKGKVEVKLSKEALEKIYEDDEDRKLYQDLADLTQAYQQSKIKEKDPSSSTTRDTVLEKTPNSEIKIVETAGKNVNSTGTDDAKMNYKKLQDMLKDCISTEKADEISAKFFQINVKKARKHLTNDLIDYKIDYHLVAPFFCRILANISNFCNDMPDMIMEKIKIDFDKHKANPRRSEDVIFDARIRNIKFLTELTKFRVIKPNFTQNIFKQCIEEFKDNDIEIIINILEGCGRFLSKHDETSERFNYLIEKLQKKRDAKMMSDALDLQLQSVIKYSQTIILKEEKAEDSNNRIPILIRYIDFLLDKLEADSHKMVSFSNEFLKLPLKSEGKIFITRVLHYVKFGRADVQDVLADVTKVIKIHYPSVFNGMLDLLSEEIFEALNRKMFEERQHQVTMMKFFTELFQKDLFSSETFWQMLYFLISYDHVNNNLYANPNDSPDSSFRIILSCTVLETYSGRRSKDVNSKSFIDPLDMKRFMVIFQIYIQKKNYLETLLESNLQELFEKQCPKLKIFKTKEEFVLADEIIRTCITKRDFVSKLHLLQHPRRGRGGKWSKYDNYDDYYSSDEDQDSNEDSDLVMLREEIKKTVAKEREENWNKFQRKLEINFEKEFESLMLENINDAESTGLMKNLNIPLARPSNKEKSKDKTDGDNEGKSRGIKLLIRGKNNKIEAKSIKIGGQSNWDLTKKDKKDQNKELDEEVLKNTLALHHQMQNEESALNLENKFINVVKKK